MQKTILILTCGDVGLKLGRIHELLAENKDWIKGGSLSSHKLIWSSPK